MAHKRGLTIQVRGLSPASPDDAKMLLKGFTHIAEARCWIRAKQYYFADCKPEAEPLTRWKAQFRVCAKLAMQRARLTHAA